MNQSITLSLDKNLIKKAKIIAAQRQTSISRMLSEELEKIIVDSMEYDWAKRRALDHLHKGFHFGGKIILPREELHER